MSDHFLKTLKETIIFGEVRSDPISKQVYSVDASIYEIEPIAIVLPKDKNDVINAVKIAKTHGIPVTARGAATGITGSCLGRALIIDTTKYLNHILEVNPSKGYAICEPGVIQDQLNEELGKQGYRLGPDTSTGNRATIGGMLGNNAAGSRSLKFGCMVDHVLEVELVLASGELISFAEVDEQTWKHKRGLLNTEGKIYREIHEIRQKYSQEIANRYPNIPRRVSGYNLNELIKPQPLNISKLIVGSEGTLGIATEIKVNICPKLKATSLCVLHFNNMIQGMHSIEAILQYHPIAVEMIDRNIIAMGRLAPKMKDKLDWLIGDPESVFIVEFEGENLDHAEQKSTAFADAMKQKNIGYAAVCLSNPSIMSHVWEVRKSGLTLLLSKRSYQRAVAFIEDVTVAPERLPAFMDDFCYYLEQQGKTAGIYGHVGSGCMHIRPYMDMRKEEELEKMEKILLDVSNLLLKHQGALSGEHGDGLVRSWLTKKMFGEKLYQAFVDLKKAFDPDNKMNPGKIVHPDPFLDNLRLSPATSIIEPKTFLDFSKEGGFSLAADLCNGNGLCRKSDNVMCPSFQATNDEYHSTRARAQTLRAIFHGKLPIEELSGKGLHDVLDLCLQCKGCKTECPSQVDMAKMKAEALFHYQKKYGLSWRDRLFANIRTLNQLSFPISNVFNSFIETKMMHSILNRLGVAAKRQLPLLAKQRFSTWYKKHGKKSKGKKVVLFSDTFTEFHAPEIGIATIKILTCLGYEVIVFSQECCGRPLISKGLLPQAKKRAEKLVQKLVPFALQQIPIIGLEPSCILTIKDDFHGLLGVEHSSLQAVSQVAITLDEFLASHIKNGSLPLVFNQKKQNFLVHGHCHQKALIGTGPTLAALRAIPEAVVTEIPSGCCGMAGSFGYEEEHYDLSMKIGELRLLPAVRQSALDTLIVANGFSCRHQIAHGTKRSSLHLAEAIAQALIGQLD